MSSRPAAAISPDVKQIRTPPTVSKKLLDGDKDRFEREKAFKETGIVEYLQSKGKRWFSLSGSNYRPGPDGVWRMWLNPLDQHVHETGAFTIYQLRQWAEDRGHVMKRRA